MDQLSGKIFHGDGKMAEAPISLSKHGAYVLFARLETRSTLQIGRLGRFDFPEGWYSYVGSAFGPGGLAARLRHHWRKAGHPHWHIDYLLGLAECEFAWVTTETDRQAEHAWAARLHGLPQASIPATGFGASDCRCRSHLFHFESILDFPARQALPGGHTFLATIQI